MKDITEFYEADAALYEAVSRDRDFDAQASAIGREVSVGRQQPNRVCELR